MKITKRQLKRIIKEAIVGDNILVHIVLDGKGQVSGVNVPYYIIQDALDDGLGLDGLFIEIEEFIEREYDIPDLFNFDAASAAEIEKIYQQHHGDDFFSDREANPHDGSMYGEERY